MSNVRAAVMVEPGNIEIQDFKKPDIKADSILLRIDRVGICGSDKHMYLGHSSLNFPVIPGHELTGTVETIGEKANDLMTVVGGPLVEGDRITTTPSSTGCGKCYFCVNIPHKPFLCPNRTIYGFSNCESEPHLCGGFSEFMYLHSKSNVFKIPDDMPDHIAALTEPAAVATRAVERAYPVGIPYIGEGYGIGKSAAVIGVGPIGLLVVAVLKHTGAGNIIALDFSEDRLKASKKMGADYTINASELSEEERTKAVKELTEGVGADVVIECAGVPGAFKEGLDMVRRGGKLVELGHYTDPGGVEIRPHVVCNKDVDILGVWAYPPMQFKTALSFLQKTDVRLEEFVTHQMKLDDLEEGIKITGTEDVIKVVIEP